MKQIFIHGSGHKGNSWDETVKCMQEKGNILYPDLSSILNVNSGNNKAK